MRPLLAPVLALLALLLQPAVAPAQDAALRPLVDALAKGGFDDTEAAILALSDTGDPAVVPALNALGEGDLHVRKSDGAVVIATRKGRELVLTDPLTGAEIGKAGMRDTEKIRVNNRLRRVIRGALGGLMLRAKAAGDRLRAAEAVFKARDADVLPALDRAIETESDSTVRLALEQARAAALVANAGSVEGATPEETVAAVGVLAARGDADAMSVLRALPAAAPPAVAEATEAAIRSVERSLAMWDVAQNLWYGLSLGSVLLLAAIGLAIVFGVMGVINMAHGEMVMLGAYTTFVVQEIIRSHAPGLFDWSLAIAVPLAFLVTGAIGVAIERGVIRFLYGRPLETLLATWGLSLIIQQAVRSIFGPTNRQVGNPSWMSDAFQLGQITITYNRLWIIVFALVVLATLMLVLKRTSFGLEMRAVTQNRRMAGSMGIRTARVDALTFGLGSGIAGIAGVALSQIDNVSPNLGQGYIVDSFMVVVFGGVGNLWGTLVGAMTLGVANKFLEPFAGAVLGKILILVFIILFIQKRPRGLFALRGRAIET